jgi:hypothetical protein
MRLIVNCMFGDFRQTYWIVGAADADRWALRDAMAGPGDGVVSIMARMSEMGTESDLDGDHERLIRTGAIQSITIERNFVPSDPLSDPRLRRPRVSYPAGTRQDQGA